MTNNIPIGIHWQSTKVLCVPSLIRRRPGIGDMLAKSSGPGVRLVDCKTVGISEQFWIERSLPCRHEKDN